MHSASASSDASGFGGAAPVAMATTSGTTGTALVSISRTTPMNSSRTSDALRPWAVANKSVEVVS